MHAKLLRVCTFRNISIRLATYMLVLLAELVTCICTGEVTVAMYLIDNV